MIDSEIIELGLYYYEKYIESVLKDIKEAMEIEDEEEVPETRDDWDEDEEMSDEYMEE